MNAHTNFTSFASTILPANPALYLTTGMQFQCEGRSVRLERAHANGVVELLDLTTLSLLQVRNPRDGTLSAPTIEWMREAYAEGMLCLSGVSPESAADRQRQYETLDPDACAHLDRKSVWRYQLAYRASQDEILKTEAGAAAWLAENYGRVDGGKAFPKPSPSSLRRWIRTLEKRERRVGSLVSLKGRRKGQSQLEPFVDALIHEAALEYYARKRAKIVDAYAWLKDKIEVANRALSPDRTVPYQLPSKEALRKRIKRLHCFDTVLLKEGASAAAKLYKASGEPILVDRILQVAYMDATTLEQVIVFDDDWQLPACKIRITALMDVGSNAILGWHVYAGPNRSETSAEAILDCMMPSHVPPQMLAAYPELAYIFGRPAAILPDNETALVGPSTIPGLNEAGITVLMPPVEMPTAKAALERFFRSLKEALAQLPGTIIDPKRAKDLDYDGVNSALLTLPQMRGLVAQVVAAHNVSNSASLDGLSPVQVWTKKVGSRVTPAFEDIAGMRRLLGRTFKALLSRDGVELNGIRYRDRAGVDILLNHMSHAEARRSQRKDGSATAQVRVRRSDGNIDSIDVFDTQTNSYVTLPSTQPAYTHKLSAWEHDYFRKQAKKRGERFIAQEARIASKAVTLAMIDEMAPKLPFQKRREMAALYQSVQVRDLCSGAQPAPFPSDALLTPQVTGDTFRVDDGFAAEDQAKPAVTKKVKYHAPPRPRGYGGAARDIDPKEFDWDSVIADPVDPETGLEPLSDDVFDDDDASELGA